MTITGTVRVTGNKGVIITPNEAIPIAGDVHPLFDGEAAEWTSYSEMGWRVTSPSGGHVYVSTVPKGFGPRSTPTGGAQVATITNHKTGETIELRRDVCHTHPEWVHRQLGTDSESDLQHYLADPDSPAYFYDANGNHLGADIDGVTLWVAEAETNATEQTYTQDEVIDLVTPLLDSHGIGTSELFCKACGDALKWDGTDYCIHCKCVRMACNSPYNDEHGSLCTDHANQAYEAAHDGHVDAQIDADREGAF